MSLDNLAVKIEKLQKRYGEKLALAGMDLEVAKGEMFGLIGPDGAGKTSLLRILATLLQADSGEAWVAGMPIAAEAAGVRRILGYMPQRFSLYQDLTVKENLRFFADLFQVPKKDRQKRTEQLLQFSRLAPFGFTRFIVIFFRC